MVHVKNTRPAHKPVTLADLVPGKLYSYSYGEDSTTVIGLAVQECLGIRQLEKKGFVPMKIEHPALGGKWHSEDKPFETWVEGDATTEAAFVQVDGVEITISNDPDVIDLDKSAAENIA